MIDEKNKFKRLIIVIIFFISFISISLFFIEFINLWSNKLALLFLSLGVSTKITFYLKNLIELSIIPISYLFLICIYLFVDRIIWGDQLKGVYMNLRKRITDRFLVEILIRHKKQLIEEQMDKDQMQKDINNIIDNFIKKTGREVEQIEIEKQGDKYKLKLRVM